MVMRLIFRMLVVAWSLAAALQEDSLYIQGKDQTGNKHPLHPYGEFDFRKDSYSFVCGANSEITEAKAKAIAILCQVQPNSTKIHRQLSSLIHKHPSLCGEAEFDAENPEFSAAQFHSILEISTHSADRMEDEIRLTEARLIDEIRLTEARWLDLIKKDQAQRQVDTMIVFYITGSLAALSFLMHCGSMIFSACCQRKRDKRTTDTLVQHKDRIGQCENVAQSTISRVDEFENMANATMSLATQTKEQLRRLKKTVKRTDAFISRPSGASPHYARQADPPVGDLLSDCVNAMPQENIFTRQSKRYATIGGRNDRKVSFQTIKGRNGQYGRSVDNISKMTEQIANQSELGGWSSDSTVDTLASDATLKNPWASFFPAPK